ncbi:DUF6221 family protein [Streptomyces sp. XH2]|uniref:DUF6221 family protein n=1 Tax=Streptomyces sp. XH2 TaxID=3412483 RepID=UPI003C7C502D
MTRDLAAFVRARLDEDEHAARAALGTPWIHREGVAGVHSDATDDYPHGVPIADCRRIPAEYECRVAVAEHIVRHQPACVLAEVEAKRRLVDLHQGEGEFPECAVCAQPEFFAEDADGNREWFRWSEPTPCLTLRLLALPYADHPDYREEWRP